MGGDSSSTSFFEMFALGKSHRGNVSAHLKGAVKVNIVPWSSIVLNPQAVPVCLMTISTSGFPGIELLSKGQLTPWIDPDTSAPAACIPFSVKGNGPWKIKLQRRPSYKQIEGRETETTIIDVPLDLQCIKVSRTGFYEVVEITDKMGNVGKVRSADPCHVVHCPELRIDPKAMLNGIDVCQGRLLESESSPSPFISLWARGNNRSCCCCCCCCCSSRVVVVSVMLETVVVVVIMDIVLILSTE